MAVTLFLSSYTKQRIFKSRFAPIESLRERDDQIRRNANLDCFHHSAERRDVEQHGDRSADQQTAVRRHENLQSHRVESIESDQHVSKRSLDETSAEKRHSIDRGRWFRDHRGRRDRSSEAGQLNWTLPRPWVSSLLQVITLNVNMELKWCDDLLRWNTSEQMCLNRRNRSEIYFAPSEIWTPDIVPINGPRKTDKDVKLQYPVLAICNGDVRWSYQEKLVSFCEIDVRYFPFDHQSCSILLQSTIYDSSQLTLRSLYRVVRLYNFIRSEWEIHHATIEEIDLYSSQHMRHFSTIRINIELVRSSRIYVMKIIFPFSIISLLALFSFCLPTDSGEKITLTVSVLLSLSIYLQIISDYVPKTEQGFCILTLYSNVIFCFVFLSCVFNIVIIFIYYRQRSSLYHPRAKQRKHPVLLTVYRSLLELNLQRCRCVSADERTNSDSSVNILKDIRSIRQLLVRLVRQEHTLNFSGHLHSPERSVKQMAVLMDRILFFLFLVSMPISGLILLQSNYQSNPPSATNQLLDLRKTAIDAVPVYRGCPR